MFYVYTDKQRTCLLFVFDGKGMFLSVVEITYHGNNKRQREDYPFRQDKPGAFRLPNISYAVLLRRPIYKTFFASQVGGGDEAEIAAVAAHGMVVAKH